MNFHEWSNEDGEVLILRRIPKNRITNGNGQGKDYHWPSGVGAVVEAPDWNPEPECGGGLHGWPWGFGLGEGSDYDITNDIWLVIGAKPTDVVGELESGAKCKLRCGIIRLEGTFTDAVDRVKSGFEACVKAASGECSNLTASGDESCAAIAATNGRIFVGKGGAFALAYWNKKDGWRFLTGKVGENGIKANTLYTIEQGTLVEVVGKPD